MRIKKILEISLQHDKEVEQAIEFNKKNNYEYIIIDTNNLIEYSNLAKLLRQDYELAIYNKDHVELRYKYYDYEKEKLVLEDKK